MIAAIILAAGESKRMGRPKMLLPWQDTMVLERVISVFKLAGVEEIVVVTGGAREPVEQIAREAGTRTAFNPAYADGEMLSSMQVGLQTMGEEVEAALIALGDQPQMRAETIRSILEQYATGPARLIVPSYRMRRGHPWLVARDLWKDLLSMRPPLTPRDFLKSRAAEIRYVESDNDSILQDLDTPEDYKRFAAQG